MFSELRSRGSFKTTDVQSKSIAVTPATDLKGTVACETLAKNSVKTFISNSEGLTVSQFDSIFIQQFFANALMLQLNSELSFWEILLW